MRELIPADAPVHWVARDDSGNVLHAGVTEPGQVTTTGLNNLITGDEAAQVRELEKFVSKRPDAKKEFDSTLRTWVDKVEVPDDEKPTRRAWLDKAEVIDDADQARRSR